MYNNIGSRVAARSASLRGLRAFREGFFFFFWTTLTSFPEILLRHFFLQARKLFSVVSLSVVCSFRLLPCTNRQSVVEPAGVVSLKCACVCVCARLLACLLACIEGCSSLVVRVCVIIKLLLSPRHVCSLNSTKQPLPDTNTSKPNRPEGKLRLHRSQTPSHRFQSSSSEGRGLIMRPGVCTRVSAGETNFCISAAPPAVAKDGR